MTADKPLHLVPKLRFPEFRDAPAWSSSPLESVCEVLNKRRVPITTKDRKAGPFPYYGASGIVDYVDDFIFDERLILVGEDGAKWGPFEQTAFIADGKYWVNNHAHVLRSVDLIDSLLEAYLVRSDLGRYVTGAAPPKLTLGKLKPIPIPIPSSPAEQQKIAECLGSLDDLIVAEGRKLDALRQHKQGLMQQLFPQAGETRPRLRFPEFQDTQEWRVAPLGKLFETTTGGTPDRARPDYWGGEVPWVTTSIVDFNVIESTRESISSAGLSNSSAKVFPKRTVLVALYGQGKTRGKVAMLGVEAATNQACAAILPSDEVDPRFVFLNLSGRYEEIRANSNSGGQKNLSQALVRALPFAYPKERAEQQRIATCLSSLDNVLAAQARKIDALKQQKQGLLQQLFPSLETK